MTVHLGVPSILQGFLIAPPLAQMLLPPTGIQHICSACRMKLEKMLILDTVLENMVPMINGKSISRKSQLVPN
jgi:hypothetical protein